MTNYEKIKAAEAGISLQEGVLPVKLSHAEVTETANKVKEVFTRLIDLIVGIV